MSQSDGPLEIIRDPALMQQRCRALREKGLRISFVPTMGFLHEGHLSLLREGRRRGDVLVLSIFVNPTQFGANEDLEAYPRDLGRDTSLAREEGVDLVFTPQPADIYPPGYATYVEVEGLTQVLCGRSRPDHFRGVTTVVCKLFQIVQPDVALFGRKDFQQLAVIRRMTEDLCLPVEIVGLPIVREADGLAMSSRNSYLTPDERNRALCLIDAIRRGTAMVRGGERDPARILEAVRQRIEQEPDAAIDYVEIRHGETLEEVAAVDREAVLLLAVRIGGTRLIDNNYLFEDV